METMEWQYYTEGRGRIWVFGSSGQARTFDYQSGDVGYVPYAMGHYIEDPDDQPLQFLEVFKSTYYANFSLDQWMALTPVELLQAASEARRADDWGFAQRQGTRRADLNGRECRFCGRRDRRMEG